MTTRCASTTGGASCSDPYCGSDPAPPWTSAGRAATSWDTGRRNVFPFSLAVAAHQVLQLVGLVAGSARVGGIGPQHYAAYPGEMTATPTSACEPDCEINALTATATPAVW